MIRSLVRDRALGAFYGLAIGDALGMPTQSLPRSLIVERYGSLLQWFEPAPDDQPLAAGLPAGHVTDDTEQAVLLAQLLVDDNGRVDPHEWSRRLLHWEDDMRRRGSLDLLGPSTRRALGRLEDGTDPADAGRDGTTNGAAMRITPVAIARASRPPERLLDAVVDASELTHNTGLGLAGAAAVASAVSAGIDGYSLHEATVMATESAATAQERGHYAAGASVSRRISIAVRDVSSVTKAAADAERRKAVDRVISVLDLTVGTSLLAQESVPAAFAAVHAADGDPWLAVRIAASVGGDTDTIAAMAGAIAGSLAGVGDWPAEAIDIIDRVNPRLGLRDLVDGLLGLRSR